MFMSIIAVGYGQDRKGTVIDAITKKVLHGASIQTKDSTAISGQDGSFTFHCNKGLELNISYIGYKKAHVSINDCTSDLLVELTPNYITLDEVEVTNSTNANKTLLYQPASISHLNESDIKRGLGLFFDDVISCVKQYFLKSRRLPCGILKFFQNFKIVVMDSNNP